jgi:hypothetical protein
MIYEILDGAKNMGENLHPDISRTLLGLIPPDSRPLVVVLLSCGRVKYHGYLVFTLYAEKRMRTHKQLQKSGQGDFWVGGAD